MKCENIRCAHHLISYNECNEKCYMDKSGNCSGFKKGLFYYIGLVVESLRRKNYVDMVELTMDGDIKIGLYYVMEIYHLKFSVTEHGTFRFILLVDPDDTENNGLNFDQISKRKCSVDLMNKFIKDIDKGILPNQNKKDQSLSNNDQDDTAGEFGWLSPIGDFRKSPFGCHEECAEWIVEDNHFGKEYDEWYDDKLDKGLDCLHKDFLIEVKGYVLIHNPSNSGGYVVSHGNRLTKAQKDFLYDYFIKIGDRWKAEQFLKE